MTAPPPRLLCLDQPFPGAVVGAAEAGHLVVFDRRPDRGWEDKLFHCRRAADSGIEIDIWGM